VVDAAGGDPVCSSTASRKADAYGNQGSPSLLGMERFAKPQAFAKQ
jgi:hypothetical protein